MAMKRRFILVGCVSFVSCLLGLAALAWACTSEVIVHRLSSPSTGAALSSGLPGTVATVSGTGFGGPVVIHWGLASGPVLATTNSVQVTSDQTAANGTQLRAGDTYFSVNVTIPDDAPGIYDVVAVGHGRADKADVVYEVVAPGRFEVLAPIATSKPDQTPVTQPQASQPTPALSNIQAPAGGNLPGDARSEAAPLGSNAAAADPVPWASPAGTAAASPAVVGPPSPASAPSVADGAPVAAADAPGRAPQAATTAGKGSSQRAVSGDLWSGFATSGQGHGSAVPGAAPSSSGSQQLALGAVLLGGGAVVLMGALAVALVSRRRARAHALSAFENRGF